MELKYETAFFGLGACIIIIGALGSYIIGIMLFKTSVLLGIGVFIVGQLASGLPAFYVMRFLKNESANTPSTTAEATPAEVTPAEDTPAEDTPEKAENTAEDSIPKDADAEEKKSMMDAAIDKYFN